MNDLSNYFEDATLNTMRGSTLTAFTPRAALFLLGSGTTFTATAATDLINAAAHGKANGDVVLFDSTGTLPAGLSKGTKYYVINANTNDFQVALTHGGTAVDITGTGTGTHSFYAGLSEAGTGMTEVSAGGYARQSITFGAPTTVNDTRQMANSAEVAWTPSGADFGIVGAMAIFDAASSGNMIAWYAVTPQNATTINTVRFQVGQLTFAMN